MYEPVPAIADPALPTLAAVLDPIQLRSHLGIFSLPPWQWGQVRGVTIRVLQCHNGRRCTIELAVHTTTGMHGLIGKVYAQDGWPVYRAMKRISRGGFGPKEEFSIPEPLAFLPELHLLLQERVSGPSAEDVFLTACERSRAAAAERCAQWLAQFHAVAPMGGPVLDLDDDLISLKRWSGRIATLGEPFARKATRLLCRLDSAAAALGPIQMCPGHGDFKPPHVILGSDRTTTCDWDRFYVADACRDVAKFVVALERLALRHFGSIRALDASAALFLKTYLALGRPGIESRLPFHKAAICVQLAKNDLSQPKNRCQEIEALLDEGLRILEA